MTHKKCRETGCQKLARNGGVCMKHGAKVKLCSEKECKKQAKVGGVCIKHGGKQERKKCSHKSCTSKVQRGGLCEKHGAKNRKVLWAIMAVRNYQSKMVQYAKEGDKRDEEIAQEIAQRLAVALWGDRSVSFDEFSESFKRALNHDIFVREMKRLAEKYYEKRVMESSLSMDELVVSAAKDFKWEFAQASAKLVRFGGAMKYLAEDLEKKVKETPPGGVHSLSKGALADVAAAAAEIFKEASKQAYETLTCVGETIDTLAKDLEKTVVEKSSHPAGPGGDHSLSMDESAVAAAAVESFRKAFKQAYEILTRFKVKEATERFVGGVPPFHLYYCGCHECSRRGLGAEEIFDDLEQMNLFIWLMSDEAEENDC